MTFQRVLGILGVLLPLFHLVGAFFAAHAILYARTSQGAVAWAMSLVFFPYVAVPLYLVFGRRKFYGYVEARRRGDRRIDHLADGLLDALRPLRSHMGAESERFSVLENLSLFPFTMGNRGRLLIDGTQTFDAIFAAIDAARHYLLVQFFIIRDDALGVALQERLIKRAAEGVRILFLYDEIGSIRISPAYVSKLRHAGVHIHRFNTRRGWRNRFQLNFRNHRKIVIADGHVAFVGGHNVGDEYLGKSARFGHWRDTHVELMGPAVAGVQWSFVEDWNWATGEILDLSETQAPPHAHHVANPALDVSRATLSDLAADAPAADGTCDALALPSGPADDIATCTLMFLAAISCARRRLWITSPYFVPDETVYYALQLAALKGVDVRIMLPAKPDHLLVYLSAFSYLESAENVGVKFYRYQAGFLHQKVMLIDDDLAAVGTANLDNRSMRLNFELTLFFADRLFAAQVAHMLEQDFSRCERATPGDLKRRRLPFRIAVRIARLLSPIQ